ncbi:MAG: type II toxin-antitoxin system prevent-host-death family antitoxin [Pseudomonadota bacterium]
MSVVKISELKNRLSHYLRQVQRGESVLISDRNHVIARIDRAGDQALEGTDDEQLLGDLERRGIIKRAAGRLPKGWLAGRSKVKADVVGALLEERRSGR